MCDFGLVFWDFTDRSDSSLKISKHDFEIVESKKLYKAIDKWLSLTKKESARFIQLCPKCGGRLMIDSSYKPYSIYDEQEWFNCNRCSFSYALGGTYPIGEEPPFSYESQLAKLKAQSQCLSTIGKWNAVLDLCKTIKVEENLKAVRLDNHIFFFKEDRDAYRLTKIVRLPTLDYLPG